MDQRLFEATVKNDTASFTNLVREDPKILEQRTAISLDTALHLASRFGHTKLVTEIVSLLPDMVAAENKKLETPMHEACHQGNDKVLALLLEIHPWVASKLNCNNHSALFIACSYGHLKAVNLLLAQRWLVEEDGDDAFALHAAASKGHTYIVCRMLEVCRKFAQRIDKNGFSALHCACSGGHFDISTMLLRVDPDLALKFDNNGYTPLHLAAIKGSVPILEQFWKIAPTSFLFPTKRGETVFHLAIKFHHCDAFKCLAKVFKDQTVLGLPDQYGNTPLHLAISGGLYDLAEYLINETTIEANDLNSRGNTVLDILDQADETNSEIQCLKNLVKRVGGRNSRDLSSLPQGVEGINSQPPVMKRTTEQFLKERFQLGNKESAKDNPLNIQPTEEMDSAVDSLQYDNLSPKNLTQHKHSSQRHRKKLIELYKRRQKKQYETHKEGLQSARNTIILVAILIATVTFTAGMNPPGGFYQDGPLKGKSTAGRTTAFKVFSISNHLALFTSLCTVSVLVSIIPFRRKPLMRLLVISHKVMLVAVTVMATAYAAGTWVTTPHGQLRDWILEGTIFICAGTEGCVFIGLGIMLARHWSEKSKYRKEKVKRRKETAERKKATDHGIKSEKQEAEKRTEAEKRMEAVSGIKVETHEDAGTKMEAATSINFKNKPEALERRDTASSIIKDRRTQETAKKMEIDTSTTYEDSEVEGGSVCTSSNSDNSDVGSAMSLGYHAF